MATRARASRLSWIVPSLMAIAAFSWSERALACSYVEPIEAGPECDGRSPAEFTNSGAAEYTSAAGLPLDLDELHVHRSSYSGPGVGDCGELGVVALRFRLDGFDDWPSNVGLELTLASGSLLGRNPSASGQQWLQRTDDGTVTLIGPDHPTRPVDATLVARALDCAGNVSEAVEIRVTDPGRAFEVTGTSDTSAPSAGAGLTPYEASHGGCSLAHASSRVPAFVLLALALAPLSRRRGRRSPAKL